MRPAFFKTTSGESISVSPASIYIMTRKGAVVLGSVCDHSLVIELGMTFEESMQELARAMDTTEEWF